AHGRVAFTGNRGQIGVGISDRKSFEAWRAHLLAATTPNTRALAATGAAFTDATGTHHPVLSDALQAEIKEKRLVPFTQPAAGESSLPPPFDRRDREADLRHAYAFFARELNIEVPG